MSDTKKSEVLEFSLTLERKSVSLTSAKGTREYALVEMTGEARDQYMNQMKESIILNADGKVMGFKTFEGMHSRLLTMCLFDDRDKPVTVDELQKFPARVLGKLFEEAQKLNGLGPEEEEDEEKND